MRETKHQIASFETVPGSRHQIDHVRAVKQYSRSSADQEMSLPKELRSEPALRMTMTYLLHEIADLCDTSNVGVSDWFHFLWDRSRSIRKDITQQELCCQGSVRLVEQCARFHIHCAGRLVAEEPQVFDQKINTENLTKCLQSLKYMYHDLRLKGDQQCANEPEFRAYIILLNLQDSNFLWEVKQLPVHIQQSAEVRFGIDVFKALEQNNYVKFFKLVRRTTYMNACLLLRYFNQVRARALATIVKAYTVKAGVALSLSSLAYTLAFEDCQAAAQFFEYYGLSCDEERVFVDRATFYYPDLPYLMDRAINIVEQKRCTSVGAAIAGGDEHLAPKSIYQNHVPENSFDSRGFLRTKGDEVNVEVEDGELGEEETVEEGEYEDEYMGGQEEEEDEEDYTDGQYDQQEVDQDDEEYDDDNDNDDEEDGDQEKTHIDDDHVFKKPSPVMMFRSQTTFKSPSTPLSSKPPNSSSSIFSSFVPQQPDGPPSKLPSLPSSGFSFADLLPPPSSMTNGFTTAAKSPRSPVPKSSPLRTPPKTPDFSRFSDVTSEAERMADELQRRADVLLLAGPQSEVLLREVCAEEVRKAAKQVLEEYRRQEDECRRWGDALVQDVVQEMLLEMYREECLDYHISVYARQKMLKRAFGGWRKRSAANRVAKDRTQLAPLWMPSVRPEEQKRELESNHQQTTLGDLARYRRGEARGVSAVGTGRQTNHQHLDVAKEIAVALAAKYPQQKQLLYHVVVSLPAEAEEGVFGCSSYLKKWFRENVAQEEEENRSKKMSWAKEVRLNSFQSIAVCLRVVVGKELRQEDGTCLTNPENENVDGIVFYASEKGNNADRSSSSTNKIRFKSLLDKFKRTVAVPVVVFNLDAFRQEERLMLDLGMNDDERVGPVLVDPRTEKRAIRQALQEGVAFLCDNFSPANEALRAMPLTGLLMGTVGEPLWMRLAINATVNAATDQILRHSEAVAEIYNEAINRVTTICAGDYSQCVEVPKELRQFVVGRRNGSDEEVANSYWDFPSGWRRTDSQGLIRDFLVSLKLNAFPRVQILNGGFVGQGARELQEYVMALFGGRRNEDVVRNVLFQMVQSLDQEESNSWVRPMQILTQQLFLERLRRASDDLPRVVVYAEGEFRWYQDTPWWLQSTVLKRRIQIDEEERCALPEEKKRKMTMTPDDGAQGRRERGSFGGGGGGLDDILQRATRCVERAERITESFKQNKDALAMISSKYDDRLSRLINSSRARRGGDRDGEEEF